MFPSFKNTMVCNSGGRNYEFLIARLQKTTCYSLLPSNLPRLLVIALLQSGFGLAFLVAGVVCSTWVAVNVGTSKRSVLIPSGDPSSLATRKGNIQISRTQRNTARKSKVCLRYIWDWFTKMYKPKRFQI